MSAEDLSWVFAIGACLGILNLVLTDPSASYKYIVGTMLWTLLCTVAWLGIWVLRGQGVLP